MPNDEKIEDLNADVPLSMHPASLKPHAEALAVPGTVGHGIFEAAKRILTAFNDEAGAMSEADQVIRPLGSSLEATSKGKRVQVPESHRAEYAAALDKAANRGGLVYDNSLAAIDSGIEAIEKRIANALTDRDRDRPSRAAQASDIRRMLLGLGDPNKATSFVSGAINSGDLVVVDAALNAQPSRP